MKHAKVIKVVIILLTLILGLSLGWYYGVTNAPVNARLAPVDIRANSLEYYYINPLLYSRTDKNLYATEFKGLRDSISALIEKAVADDDVDSASVYYRDMNTSHWTGFNEDEKYDPSSMLKVAVMMAYLKDSTKDSSLLKKKLSYPGSDTSGQFYKPEKQVPAGMYSVDKLIEMMIRDSDNVAMNVLMENDLVGFNSVYNDFRLPHPVDDANDYMSARSYSVLFRSLYNSTYLPWDLSERVLRELTDVTFRAGLAAGVPSTVTVSNKFGEHTYIKTDGTVTGRELHDCGIVYYPGHPYFLCIMTKGKEFPKLATVIAHISKTVYEYVETVK